MIRFLIALIAILSLICSAEISNWAYESGRVHFGGKPKVKDRAELPTTQVAASSNQVFMCSAAWFSYCKQAHQCFRRNGISFIKYDIEKSESARRAYDTVAAIV